MDGAIKYPRPPNKAEYADAGSASKLGAFRRRWKCSVNVDWRLILYCNTAAADRVKTHNSDLAKNVEVQLVADKSDSTPHPMSPNQ